MNETDHSPARTVSTWKRWLSLRGYGIVTSTLFEVTWILERRQHVGIGWG